LRKTINIASAK